MDSFFLFIIRKETVEKKQRFCTSTRLRTRELVSDYDKNEKQCGQRLSKSFKEFQRVSSLEKNDQKAKYPITTSEN